LKAIIFINSNVVLNILGAWHDEQIRKECISFIQSKSLEKFVKYVGVKYEEQKWFYYARANIFCLPTYETEAMPITLLEAMMFELPIITTNWRSIPDIVTDGEEGFLVPINSPKAIAEKIELLSNDKNLREQMGRKGREKFLKEYTIERHLSRMAQAFKEVLIDT